MSELSNTNDFLSGWTATLPVVFAIFLLAYFLTRSGVQRISSVSFTNRQFHILVAAVAALSAIYFSFLVPTMPWGGGDKYFNRAFNLVTCGVFGYDDRPTALFPPGYSFLLMPAIAAGGESPWTYFITNFVLLAGSAYVFRFIARRIGAPGNIANFLAAVLLLYPNRLFSVFLPFSDVPFALVSMMAFGFFMVYTSTGKSIYIVVTALLAGFSALIRGNGLLLFLPTLPGILLVDRMPVRTRIAHASYALIIFCLVIAPWTIRNYGVFNTFVPVSTNGGLNLALANNEAHPIVKDALCDSIWTAGPAWKFAAGKNWNEAQQDSFYAGQGFRYLTDHPWQTLRYGSSKVIRAFSSDAYSFGYLNTYTNATTIGFSVLGSDFPNGSVKLFVWSITRIGYRVFYILNNTAYYFLLVLFIITLFTLRKKSPAITWPLTGMIIIVCIFIVLIFGFSRYKEPIGTLELLAFAYYAARFARPVGNGTKQDNAGLDTLQAGKVG